MNDEIKEKGSIHPINIVINDIVKIFTDLGFQIELGNEIEDEKHNFDDLNVPKDHPARDMQDTFWLKDFPFHLLRTQTSGVQIHFMEKNKPPFKIISPGKVYRYEATDKTHELQFHQIEGLVVGENISLANLKFALNTFIKKLYGENIETRFRPGYFPFVEPGVEMDMRRPNGKWIEILGAGMVHPNVLRNVGIDSEKYSGFAFGIGIERVAMLRYGISDVRDFYNADLRLINQF